MSEVKYTVSVFKDIYDIDKPFLVNIDKVFERIKNGKSSKPIIEKIIKEQDKKEQDKLKKKLAVICFAGQFSHRNNDGIIEHSGLICIDFDKVGDRLNQLRTRFENDKYTFACFLSPRRDGIKVIVKIPTIKLETEDEAGHKKLNIDHKSYFEGLRMYYKESTMDDDAEVARACFESYDENIFINPNSALFDIRIEPKVDVNIDYTTRKNRIKDPSVLYDKIKKWLEKNEIHYENGNKHRYLVALASACNRFGISQDITIKKVIEEFQTKADYVASEDFIDIVERVYISYHNQFDISWLTDQGEMNDFNPTGPARDVIYVNDIQKEMIKSFTDGDSKGDTTHFKSIDQHWTWKTGELTVMGGIPNHGKAVHVNTCISTPYGWKTMGEIQVGDKVFDEQGNVCNVTFATAPMYKRPCYKLTFNDGTEIIADEEHLWFTETSQSRRSYQNAKAKNRLVERKVKKFGTDQSHKRTYGSVKTTKQIAETMQGDNKGNGKYEFNHSIPLAKPIQIPEKQLLISSYVLGCWLGDGSSNSGTYTCGDQDSVIIDNIRDEGFVVTKRKQKIMYGIHNLSPKLRQLNLINNKHIPIDYLRSSVDQRIELLKGLMDTDGSIDKTSICEYTSVNKQLADDVYELVTSLGMKCVIYEGDATLYGRVTNRKYRVTFKPNFNPFKLKRKEIRHHNKRKNNHRFIVSCEPVESVPVKCIQVDSPSKLYLCTKSFIPTHNTTMMLQLCLIRSVKEGMKWGVFSPEQNPPIDFYKDLIHTYIGKSTEKYHSNQMSLKEFEDGMKFINDHFFFVYPKDDAPTPDYINERFSELIFKHKVDGCIIDPFNQLDNDWGKNGRDDHYISGFLSKEKRFGLEHNVYKIIIAHPKNNLEKKKNTNNYECPTEYNLAGGAMWANKCDNILATYRPYFGEDKSNPSVEFRSQKIKKQKYVGIPGIASLSFDIFSNRYIEFAELQTVTENGRTFSKWVGISPFDADYEEKYAELSAARASQEANSNSFEGVKGLKQSNDITNQLAQRKIAIPTFEDVTYSEENHSDDFSSDDDKVY